MSRGFLCTLFGVGMTLWSWYAPWSWPAFAALAVIRVVYGSHFDYADLPFAGRAAFLVLLIAVNSAAWAAVGWAVVAVVARARR